MSTEKTLLLISTNLKHAARIGLPVAFLLLVVCASCRRRPSSASSQRAACEASMQTFFWLYDRTEDTPQVKGDAGFMKIAKGKTLDCPAARDNKLPFYYSGLQRRKELGIILVEKEASHHGKRAVLFSDGAIMFLSNSTWVQDSRTYLLNLARGGQARHTSYNWDKVTLPIAGSADSGIQHLRCESFELSDPSQLPDS